MFRVFCKIQYYITQLKIKLNHLKLSLLNLNQVRAFRTRRNDFSTIYNKIRKYPLHQFLMPVWEDYNQKIEKAFLPHPPFSFLTDATIASTMVVTSGGKLLEEELSFLEKKIPKDKLRFLLAEDSVGHPLILNSGYLTSHNSIHHLYHLLRFLDRTRCDLDQTNTIVEWGGGYGNMAKIYRRLKSGPCTYTIIDTPLFSSIQWLYLTTILGKEKVNLLQDPQDTIQVEKINLLPLCFLDRCQIQSDLFISTWALSESSRYAQDYVVTHNWFKAKHILLAYQDSSPKFPHARNLEKIALNSEAIIENIEFLPGNHYAFR